MNSTLTLPALDSQLVNLDSELAQLQNQIKEKKALRKAIAHKKETAVKLISKLETALLQVSESVAELGNDFKAIAEAKVREFLPQPSKQSNLVEFPQTENKSNDYDQYD